MLNWRLSSIASTQAGNDSIRSRRIRAARCWPSIIASFTGDLLSAERDEAAVVLADRGVVNLFDGALELVAVNVAEFGEDLADLPGVARSADALPEPDGVGVIRFVGDDDLPALPGLAVDVEGQTDLIVDQ